ncbi:hypothetical protein [Stenotrophomonas oahuensis]|uniref:Lipoprotein n=1 Tax=Stenotrophomonas oahuensis TaxID=3003271 RepID=A0ABY9YNY3_9GAMM|nr:hypothetical protein [Stenotrophomonas sp. A5586]WNH52306.1 hypothetical protein PDM29_18555 [Stenotrophomonas sp. A5586]
MRRQQHWCSGLTRTRILLAASAMGIALSVSSCKSPPNCNYDVVNHSPHSGFAQRFEVDAIRALVEEGVTDGATVELHVMQVWVELPKPDVRRLKVSYAVTDSENRQLSSGTCIVGLEKCSKAMIEAARRECRNL